MLLALKTSGGAYSGILSAPDSRGAAKRPAKRIARAGREQHGFMFIVFAFLNEGNCGDQKLRRLVLATALALQQARTQVVQISAEILNQAPSAFSIGRSPPCD